MLNESREKDRKEDEAELWNHAPNNHFQVRAVDSSLTQNTYQNLRERFSY